MTTLWTSEQAAAATGGVATAAWTARGVSIDSRTLESGDLFIAIRGPNHDGSRFVESALDRGAAAAMVSNDIETDSGAPLLIVEDTTMGLEDLGRAARDRGRAKIVGVTGSMGKTGTKEALALALGRQGPTSATKGNLNNQWGLPLSLARMPKDTAYGVFELGMNRPGEIDALSRMARPDVAVITNVDAVHLEFFDSESAIATAKAEIFLGMGADGIAVLNRDNAYFEQLRDAALAAGVTDIRTFGVHANSTSRLIDATMHDDHSDVAAQIEGETIHYVVGSPGQHWVMNSLAVLATVAALGADVAKAAEALADLRPLPGRGARTTIKTPSGPMLLIDESYNASPTSMRAALNVLGAAGAEAAGRRIAVLGDMLELGPDSAALHAGLADGIADNDIDLVFTVGPNMNHLAKILPSDQAARHANRSKDIVAAVLETVAANDIVMVKGSLGSRMAAVVDALLALDQSDQPANGR
ncbi:MAG: UDP-N-acetylmuramoylalanyl-D-glutamyl-2,6-diaminopimelate--D-alanyl-D-alanine ligase [Rhodospirillaceae bacterium]|jgi:UDP-N-acetylmuramoyl-tripeptide--D-alanyl-D-alanine ligase|nr:UDP-N-acetylmuramoylalanyl-D-glutamyl-2,6-diaminopimelate--D-alanyl-D-alanine ligase [Rhodospirillaceae bacterium]MBT5664041.1 UDP-N-acetylmuramoylalanyl-D-glutamyl-2,6-diaminopimelate--D-alanyl-D-alanine ligase [Rhodospirillaceae bacterium]